MSSIDEDEMESKIERLAGVVASRNQTILRLRAALKKIADQDYRGNRPPGAEIAFNALKNN